LDYKETGVNKMEFQEKNVLVFGSGKSGIAAAELLEKQNANIFVFEGNEKQSVNNRNFLITHGIYQW